MAKAKEIIITLLDDQGNKNTTSIKLPSTTTEAAVQTFFTSYAALLDAVTDSAIVSASLSTALTVPGGVKSSPTAGANNNSGAMFMFVTDGLFYTRQRIPAFIASKYAANSEEVDQTDADVIALVGAMVDGLAGTEPCDARDDDIGALTYAREQFLSTRYT